MKALTTEQRKKLKKFNDRLEDAIQSYDFVLAQSIVKEIGVLLVPLKKLNLFMQYNNKYLEMAVEQGHLKVAIQELERGRRILNSNTRTYLQ